MIGSLFNEVLYRPFLNILVLFYRLTGDLGISIILLTLLIKFLLYPLLKKQLRSRHEMKKLQPKLEAVKKKHKDDKEKQGKAILELYKEEGISPAAGCIPALIQLPILIALYRVFLPGKALIINGGHLGIAENMLYSWPIIQGISEINKISLGVINLTEKSILLAILSAVLQFLLTKMSIDTDAAKKAQQNKEEMDTASQMQKAMNTQMIYFMPVLTFFFGMTFPAALPLYWSASTAISIVQQWYFERKLEEKS